jgi:uncharacterized protein YndB with AHSA1/START domain
MACTDILIDASPEDVFAIFADGSTYSEWVVGAQRIRDVDETWPAPGARLHHSVGVGPITLDDITEVTECEAPYRLVLEAKVRPTGTARVVLQVTIDGSGTRVQMEEAPVGGPARFLPSWIADPLIDRRNDRALARLKDMVEQRSSRSTTP